MKMDIDTIPNLYSITGNVLDINTVLINREELRKLVEAKKDLLELADVWLEQYGGEDYKYCPEVEQTRAIIGRHKD